ncbi:MAG TPA: cell division protein FtsZ, partial [Solirubrobacteraceae bacterium]|nr:cell division protein FtsZ [Solirubrobacteraceae bacterium]
MREGPLAALFRKTDELPGPGAAPAAAPAPPPPHPRETGLPHPALAASQPATEAARTPVTPQDRLRHAFSSEAEIPENILEPAPREPEPRVEEFDDVYARDDRDVYARADLEARVAQARAVGQPVLRVVGVGGAGVNAVNRMVEAEVNGVEFIAINTDLQSLQQSTADVTLHIGAQITRGLGSGANTDLGRRSAMEEYDRIKALLKGSD